MHIRDARPADLPALLAVHLDAFGDEGPAIARLVQDLFADETAQPLLALVAETEGRVVGNVIFSAVHIVGAEDLSAFILAPLAVAPGAQRAGIGRALVEAGLEASRQHGAHLAFVLGDPGYYGRFGFTPRHRVRAPHELPYPEAWMALALQDGALDRASGRLACARCLGAPEYW